MMRSQLRQIISYLRPHYRDLALGTVALFLVNGLGTYIPWLIRTAIDDLSKVFSQAQVLYFVAIIAGLASLMWIIRMASRMWLFGIGRAVEFDLRQRLFEHLLKLPPSYFSVNSAGTLISIATSDVENVRRLLGFAILSLINTIFAYAMTLPAMLALNPQLSLIAIAPYPLMLLLVQMFGGSLRDQQLRIQDELANASSLLQEDLNGMALIKTYAQEENERQAFSQVNRRLLDANLQMALTRNILFPVLGGIASVSLLLLLWFGGSVIATNPNGSFQIGSLIALFIYIERLIFPTALLGFTITTYQRGKVSIQRIENILETVPDITDESQLVELDLTAVQGQLSARNLCFTYPDSDTPALDHLNFEIAAGERIAIIGGVGSGKSTLANALPRLLNIAPGQLFIDGKDITKLKLAHLRAIISYVPQDSFLFSATIANNIRYGQPDAPINEVENFARLAGIQTEILNFPQKYETLVGERGITLSGGQRQRTALARALLVDSPILVLDDSLSSVDNQTATKILDNLPRDKTVIFISHQMAAAANCDRLMLMDKGKIVATGTHQDLLRSSDLYNKLWYRHQLEEVLR